MESAVAVCSPLDYIGRACEVVLELFRNCIQGFAGGLLSGGLLGLAEAVYLLSTLGAPDLLSPAYAVALYAVIGAPIGIGGGLLLSIADRMKWLRDPDEALAFAIGGAIAGIPMLGFVLRYLANKVVYAEQGVPLTGLAGIGVVVLVYVAMQLLVVGPLVRVPLSVLLKAPGVFGAWGGLLAICFGISFVEVQPSPRDNMAANKPVPAALKDAPNVLIVSVDTLRADYLGTYGRPNNPSPVLDGIAADGVVFEQAFASASWTRSSFASLWSSRIPSAHNTDKKASMMPDDLVLLSEVLQDGGVTTGNLVNNINVTSTFNFDQGWDTFIYEAPDYSFGATESVFSLTFYKVIHKLNEKLGGAKSVSRFYQPVEVLTEDAKRFIEANRDGRWMLNVHLMEPHDPYFEHPYLDGSGDAEFNGVGFARAEVEKPAMDQVDYLKRVYEQEITHMDRKLESFVEWLKSEGVYDNTLIVITADHGEEFGEHGGFWHGTTLYVEQLHVPLIIKLPKQELAGTRVRWQARTIDVAPTITAAMGLEPSDQWQGADLMGDVRTEIADRVQRAEELAELTAVLAEPLAKDADQAAIDARAEHEARLAELQAEPDPCAAYANERDRLLVAEEDFEGNVISAIRQGGFKLIRANEGNPRGLPGTEMFDVVEDHAETKSLGKDAGQVCGVYGSDRLSGLDSELGKALVEAKRDGKEGGQANFSEAERQNLCALGYLSGDDCK